MQYGKAVPKTKKKPPVKGAKKTPTFAKKVGAQMMGEC